MSNGRLFILILTAVAAVSVHGCRPEPEIRILTGGIRHESNSFCPIPTTADDFQVRRGEQVTRDAAWARYLEEAGVEVIPTTHADCRPSGVVTRQAYEKLKKEILDGARRAGAVNGVYLDLHGALHVDGYEDAQSDLVRSIRGIVGDGAVIAASLDLHGNISPAFASEADILTGYRTAPHVDAVETRLRAVRLLLDAIKGGRRPVTTVVKVPILIPGEKGITAVEPLASIYGQVPSIADKPGLLDASVFVGMAWTDIPRASMSVLVVAEAEQHREAALAEARRLAGQLWERRDELRFDVPTGTIDNAIRTALQAAERTVFITDSGDNTTAGAAGDTTLVLERLMAKGVTDAVMAGIVDAAAVEACERAGVGSRVNLTVGGKIDTINGRPLQIEGTVRFVSPPDEESSPQAVIAGVRRRTGRTAVMDVDGILVALLSVGRSFTAPSHFEEVGIDPLDHKIVVVKLGYLFQALRDIAPRTIMALTPGFAYQLTENLPYRNIRRPMYPIDRDMIWSPEQNW